MERDRLVKGRESAKVWDLVAAANAAVGAVEKDKGGAREAAGEAEGEARAAALAKTRGQQKAPAQPIRETKKNQTPKPKEFIMPFGDGTSPMGQRPMSGRGQGFCAGFNNPGNMNRGPEAGRGGGWRHRHWFHATGLTGWQRAAQSWPHWGNGRRFFQLFFGSGKATQEQELAFLQHQAAQLKDSLDNINQRIEELAAPATAKSTVEPVK